MEKEIIKDIKNTLIVISFMILVGIIYLDYKISIKSNKILKELKEIKLK
jgi:hypothetical protein